MENSSRLSISSAALPSRASEAQCSNRTCRNVSLRPHELDSTIAVTSSGCLIAHSWQMAPPMEEPIATHGASPSAWCSACASSARSAMRYGPGVIGLRPMPRLSNVTQRRAGLR